MKFLQIGIVGGREVAYLLDEAVGKVYRVLVEDFTGARPAIEHVPQTFVPPMNDVSRFNNPPREQQVPVPAYDSPHPVVQLPDKPRSIMPPGLASMMQEGNETVYKPGGM